MKTVRDIALGVVFGLLGAGVLLLATRPARGEPVRLSPPPTPAPILVHVAGAVVHPQVYSLPPGSRVQEALAAAGGHLPEADLSALNLAAPLEDGERLWVPSAGAAVTPAPTGGEPASPGRETSETLPERSPGRINLNTASPSELESLPGIGPALAQRIVAYRQAHGPFTRAEDLLEVPGIGPATFAQIESLITLEGGS